MDRLYANLLSELECPGCSNYMPPPIRQCKTGHSICEKCTNQLFKCPICQQNFTKARSINLESLAIKMQYPCTNSSYGCQERLTFIERNSHMKVCSYKKYSCPLKGCFFTGSKSEIKSHWDSKKLKTKTYGIKKVGRSKLKANSYFVRLVEAYNENFWFKKMTKQEKICWALQYIGDSNKALDYYFEIEVFKPDFPKKRIIYSDYCQPIEINNDDLFSKNNCLSATFDSLDNYIGNDKLLTYCFRVFKSEKTSEQIKQYINEDNSSSTCRTKSK
ncbi:E3 ubiquitin-protein ligase siah2-like [Agrilus planipennis]|uniref:E3 ubiquitin-protein ligase n=1 Tax=Agrilus planipennis TaxID=224129 RepID=A0A1W4XAW8_AGRPL|nr:E3 ubiquitin-protein ligase siah2-like [Agrilus planipennis]